MSPAYSCLKFIRMRIFGGIQNIWFTMLTIFST